MAFNQTSEEQASSDNGQLTTLTQNELVPASGQQETEPQAPAPKHVQQQEGEWEDPESLAAYENLRKSRAAKKRKRRIKIAVVLALAGGIAAVAIGRGLLGGGGEEEEVDLVPQTTVVERTDFSNVISASGALKAGTTVMVTPEVDGFIESIRVSEGQEVQKGDVLFTLRNEDLDKAVREAGQEVEAARQGVASAQREVSDAEAARNEAWSKYDEEWAAAEEAHQEWQDAADTYDERYSAWARAMKRADKKKCAEPVNPGAAPTDDKESSIYKKWEDKYDRYLDDLKAWEEYQALLADAGEEPQPAGEEPVYPDKPEDSALLSAIEGAQEGVTSANQALDKANEAYNEAVANADKRTVTAPSSGSIVELNAKVGQAVGGASGGYEEGTGSGASDTLVQISNMNQMAVDIEVNEIDILNVKKGQWAKVTFSAVEDAEVDAQVQEVSTVASGSGGGEGGIVTFHVGLVIPNPDPRLRPGMTANVNVYTADLKDVLVVPATALIDEDGKSYVEVVTAEGDPETGEGFESEQREVKVGERGSSDVVIESGVEEGETIVLTAGMDLDVAEMDDELDAEEW